jgi:hypothetical protein
MHQYDDREFVREKGHTRKTEIELATERIKIARHKEVKKILSIGNKT